MITINGNTYALKALNVTESCILEKNGKAEWLIPDELVEDFIQIFAYAGAAVNLLKKYPPPNSDDQKGVDVMSGTKPEN